jgi:hypothetical protein
MRGEGFFDRAKESSPVVLTNRKDLIGPFQFTLDKIDNDDIDFEKDLGELHRSKGVIDDDVLNALD